MVNVGSDNSHSGQICPDCGSANIWGREFTSVTLARCRDCGRSAYWRPEQEDRPW